MTNATWHPPCLLISEQWRSPVRTARLIGGSTLKISLSISHLILPLFALASAHCLSAQTLVVDKPTLALSARFGGPAVTQTVNVTSTNGASIPVALIVPQAYSWLKVSVGGGTGQSIASGYTPLAVTVTADPTGLVAGTYPAEPPALIAVSGGAPNTSIAVTLNVSTIGVNPQSLAFTYTVGSNNFPLPQGLTLSSAAATQCTATAAVTTTSGSWVGPLQNPCVSPSNLTVQLNNSVVELLAANTYTGTITIAPPAGQGPPAVVSLRLTVLPTPPVTVNPQSLILNWQTGIGAPNPSQTFTISTTASQPLDFNFFQSLSSLSNISTITPPFGNTSLTTGAVPITYSVNATGLAVGTHTGSITLFTPGGSPTQQNIGVTLNVSNTALLNVPNAPMNFTSQLGSIPAPQDVNITATSGILNYSVTQSVNSAWLSVPNAGSTSAPLTVSVNPAGLPQGTYTATVNVLSAIQGSIAQQIPVVLKITNDPTISASASTLSFPYQIGQSAAVAQRLVKLTSITGVPLNYVVSSAATTCGTAWLQATNSNNLLSGVTDDTLRVSVDPAGLPAGTCTGKVTVTATNPATGAPALGSPLEINVTLTVSTTAQLVLTPPDPPVFTVGKNQQSAAPPILLTSTGTDVLTYTVAFQSPGSWLSVNTLGGATNTNNSLILSVNTVGLAAGPYYGTVTLTATGPGGAAVANSPVKIPVTLNVTAGSLTLSASSLSFEQTVGGPAPASQTVTLGSDGAALNYNAVVQSNRVVSWLSVSPASGTTGGALTIAVDGSKLTPGTYTATIAVTSPGGGNSPATITVNFKLVPGTLSAPNTTLTFTQAVGGPAPAPQSIAVAGSPAALNYTVVSAPLSGVWLSATPASGTTPSSVEISVNGATLPVGQYTGTVTIASTGAGGSPIAVGVILNVVAPGVLAALPTSLSFAHTIGLAAPAPQNLAISSIGSVPVTALVQLDGVAAGWLTVAPAGSGITPATLAVSVAPLNLAAGQYTGRIVIASPLALAAVTVPVTLTVTAIPQPVVTGVTNAANYATGAVSPGENIVIFGSGVGPAEFTSASPVNNVFPTLVGATRVFFDNVAAPIVYVSAGQTSVMVPYGVAGGSTTNIVVEYSGVQSAPRSQIVALAAPGIYTLNMQGTGPGAILNQDGLTVNGLTAPEKRGNVIAIYMTGEGSTTPQGVDGVVIPVSALKKPQQTVTVTVGGVDAVVEYAGSAPGLISGVMQVNVRIPLTAPTGTQPVVVTVGTVKSQSDANAATVVIN